MLHHPKNIFDQNSAVIAHFSTKKKRNFVQQFQSKKKCVCLILIVTFFFRAICFRLKLNRTVYPMRAVFFHKTSLQSECSCILDLPADDTGSLPVLKDDNGTTAISNRPIGTSNDDVNYHCEEGKSYDITIGISLKKTDRNNATALLPVVATKSYDNIA